MLAVVLIVNDGLDPLQPFPKGFLIVDAMGLRAIGISAPCDIGCGEVGAGGPYLFVDERLQTGTISAGHGAENPMTGHGAGFLWRDAGGFEFGGFGPHAGGDGIVGLIFIECAGRSHRLVEQFDLGGEGIAEES